uniref:HERV-H LTR-associating 1 n=1 Tax=Molossus molossus TaxID=27622 RepID=A0A7J8DSZ0_MOLMO|nr:HERV-H LTR-associating 1 [Molossus molossus]
MPGFLVHGAPARLCVGLACVLSLWNTVSAFKGEGKKEKVTTFLPTTVLGSGDTEKGRAGAVLAATELPARLVDLSALNLTEVVNGMLSRALKDSKKFFSLLSITSYSSFAFHKFSVAIYNISNLKAVDQAKFPTRYCYCLSNRTNGLSDFTALLVDVIGNSTSYLTEIFKSTSILSVSQRNDSDCVFICVMTGQSGRNLSDFWEMAEKSPVVNYTFTSSLSGVPAARTVAGTPWATASRQAWAPTRPVPWAQTTGEETAGGPPWETLSSTVVSLAEAEDSGTDTGTTGSPSEPPAGTHGSPSQTRPASGTLTPSTQTPSPTKAPAPRHPQTGDLPWSFTPGEEPALVPGTHQVQASRCPQQLLREGPVTAAPPRLATQKLNICLMELCRFFQQCLCGNQRRDPGTEAGRHCLEYYSWFLKGATSLCQKARRLSHSHTLKQRCLENICKSV